MRQIQNLIEKIKPYIDKDCFIEVTNNNPYHHVSGKIPVIVLDWSTIEDHDQYNYYKYDIEDLFEELESGEFEGGNLIPFALVGGDEFFAIMLFDSDNATGNNSLIVGFSKDSYKFFKIADNIESVGLKINA